MRRLALILLFLLVGAKHGFSQPACTVSNIGPGESAVQMAVDSASDGDVICLASGTANYVNGVALGDKALEIRGAGTMPSPWGSAKLTVLHSQLAQDKAFFAGTVSTVAGHNSTISNIRFTVGADTPLSVSQPNIAHPALYSFMDLKTQPGGQFWTIHHNDFEITGLCGGLVITISMNQGVIYRNVFSTEIIADEMGADICRSANTNINGVAHFVHDDDGSSWASASTFGTADTGGSHNLYVETNKFTNFNVSADADTSAREVWRFNSMYNASMADHGYDSSQQGHRHTEYYDNTHYCDQALKMSALFDFRGGTHKIFDNTFPPYDASFCGIDGHTGTSPLGAAIYKFIDCLGIGGWPGDYNGGTGSTTYPASHQIGWGWISGLNQAVGASTAQGNPGGAGFQQALEPTYIFHNTNNTGNPLLNIASGYISSCRAMAYSNTGKGGGAATTLVIPNGSAQATPYVNVGQEAVVVFSDLVGGSTPTIADSLGNSWSALTGGTNGSRLTAWHSHITTGGAMVVTITFGSSSAARAGTLITLRGMTASPVDVNPATTNSSANPQLGTTSGTLAQTNEIVLGYFGLNGPIDDGPSATFPDIESTSCFPCGGGYNNGIIGTTGSTATTNATVGVTYRSVISTSGIQPTLANPQSRAGVAGTLAFKVTSNDNTKLDLQVTDFFQEEREVYETAAMFDGTTGTGSGVRASRPVTCMTGVAYWSTDQGSWNSTGADGVLDKCTDGSNGNPALRWTNAWYVPYYYPHPLATVTGGSCTPDHLAFSLNPSDTTVSTAFSATASVYDSNGVKCTDATNTITIANKGGTCTGMTLGGTKSGAAIAGDFATTDLTLDAAGDCTLSATADVTGADSTPFTISAAPGGGSGLRLNLRLKGFGF